MRKFLPFDCIPFMWRVSADLCTQQEETPTTTKEEGQGLGHVSLVKITSHSEQILLVIFSKF